MLTLSGKEYKVMELKCMISARFVEFGRVSTGFDKKQYPVSPGSVVFRQVFRVSMGSNLSMDGLACFHRVSQIFPVLQGFVRFARVPQGFAGFRRVVTGF